MGTQTDRVRILHHVVPTDGSEHTTAPRVGARQWKGLSFLPAMTWPVAARPVPASPPGTQFPSSANPRIRERRRSRSGNSHLPAAAGRRANTARPREFSQGHASTASVRSFLICRRTANVNGFLMWTRPALARGSTTAAPRDAKGKSPVGGEATEKTRLRASFHLRFNQYRQRSARACQGVAIESGHAGLAFLAAKEKTARVARSGQICGS